MVLVRQIMITEPNYRMSSDDGSPAVEDFMPPDHPSLWYVLAYRGDLLLGMWAFLPENSVSWDVHTRLLPVAYGRWGLAAAKELAKWIWENTPCRRITTKVPSFNRLALAFAKKAGMVEMGVNPKSFLKGGVLYDQILLGMSKEVA